MKYLIGVDGGGTKTDCPIADLSAKIINEISGKPSNFLIIGIQEAVENIFTLIEENLFQIGGDFANVKLIVIGVAGAGRDEDAKLLEKSFKDYSEEHDAQPVKVCTKTAKGFHHQITETCRCFRPDLNGGCDNAYIQFESWKAALKMEGRENEKT